MRVGVAKGHQQDTSRHANMQYRSQNEGWRGQRFCRSKDNWRRTGGQKAPVLADTHACTGIKNALTEKSQVCEGDGGHCLYDYRAAESEADIVATLDLKSVHFAGFEIEGLLSTTDA